MLTKSIKQALHVLPAASLLLCYSLIITCHASQDDPLLILPRLAQDGNARLAISPDNRTIAVPGQMSSTLLFNATDGRLVRRLEGVGGGFRSVAFTPDGRYLATIGVDGNNAHVRAWRTTGWIMQAEFRTPVSHLSAFAISPDGRWIAIGAWNYLKVFSLESGEEVKQLSHPPRYVLGLTFSPDGQYLAASGESSSAKVWRVSDWSEVAVVATGLAAHSSLAFSPDSGSLALSEGTTVRVWRIGEWETPIVTLTRGAIDGSVPVTFSPDGSLLAVRWTARAVKLFRTSDWQETVQVNLGNINYLWSLALTNNKLFASVYPTDFGSYDAIARYDVNTGAREQVFTTPVRGWVTRLSLSADASRLALTSTAREAMAISLPDGQQLFTFGSNVRDVAISPDGNRVATVGSSTEMYRLSDGQRIWSTAISDAELLAFHPIQNQLMVLRAPWYVGDEPRLLDGENGALIRTFASEGNYAKDMVFSPDGGFLVTTRHPAGWNDDRYARFWRVSDGTIISRQEWYGSSVVFTPAGDRVVVATGRDIAVYEVERTDSELRFSLVRRWRAHDSRVNQLRLSPNGNIAVSAGEDGAVKVWRIEDGGLERTLRGMVEPAHSIGIARDGEDYVVASGGWGGLGVWRFPAPGLRNTPPSSPELLYPAQGATVNDWVLTLRATDVDEGAKLRYRVEILRDGQVVKVYDATTSPMGWNKSSYDSEEVAVLSVELEPGVYTWRAQVTDGWSWSGMSETRSFTLTKLSLTLGQSRTITLNAGSKWRALLNVPEGSERLFLSLRSVEQADAHTIALLRGTTTVAQQTSPNALIVRVNPAAGEYEVEITPASSRQAVLFAGTQLPAIRAGVAYTGTIYHNDGLDWLQYDVPSGTRSLQFTYDAPGTLGRLEVFREQIDGSEKWSAQHWQNPPVRLNIQNPPAGRYYIRVYDHGALAQSQVRAYSLLLAGAHLNLSANTTPASAVPGDEITVNIQYSNIGNITATESRLECTLPEKLSVVEGSISDGGSYDPDTRKVTWNIGRVAVGDSGARSFRVAVATDVPEGAHLTSAIALSAAELGEEVRASMSLWVGSAQVKFDNVYTLFNYSTVTIGNLSIDTSRGAPSVTLVFPAGTAVSTEVPAEEVSVSEDGTKVTARFALFHKVLQNVAPTLRLQHPSVGTLTWQAPTFEVFGVEAAVEYGKPFVRQGRRERSVIRVSNPTSMYQTPLVILSLPLENMPTGQTFDVEYWLYGSDGALVKRGNLTGSQNISVMMPPLAPLATAIYSLEMRVTGSRSQIRTRLEPMSIAIITVVSTATIIGSWAGHSILQQGCERALKRRLREEFADAGFDLDDRQVNIIFGAYTQAGSFASAWLSELMAGATEQGIKDLVKAKYGDRYTKAAEIAYKVYKGEHPMDMLLNEIAGQASDALGLGLDWSLLPASAAVKAFLSEGVNCIDNAKQLRQLSDRLRQRRNTRNLPVTSSWDPNAKAGTFGVDGFIAEGEAIDYTVFFENLPQATAAAEEVRIDDILDAALDDSTLVFTGFGLADREISLPVPTARLAEDIDFRPTKNLIVQVRGSYDPSTRKIVVTFKGIDPATGDHYEDGFLPPNTEPPAGEGYVSFRILPKADLPSATRIINRASIVFDPHLGQNPAMETNEHVVTIDKQAPQTSVVALSEVQPKPSFQVAWEGNDDASGVFETEVWYSENGAAFQLWQVLRPGETGRSVTGSDMFNGKFGYTYRFHAVGKDKVGNRSGVPPAPQAETTAGRAPQIPSGLQLVTFPVNSEEADARRIIAFDADKLATYVPGTGYVRYPNASVLVGAGMWVQLGSTQRPDIRGTVPDESEPFSIPLKQGWNLIGNPWLEDLPWNLSAVKVEVEGQRKNLAEAQSAGWIEDYAWGWDGSKYALVYDNSIVPGVSSQLLAWRGYWVYAHRDCALLLPSPSAGRVAVTRSNSNTGKGWSFPIRIRRGEQSAEVTVGMVSSGRGLSIGLPPDPPTNTGSALRLSVIKQGRPLAADVRSTAGKQTWDIRADWMTPANDQPSEPIVLSFGNVARVPRGTALWLIDQQTGKRYYIRTTASYQFTPLEGEVSRSFQLVAEADTSSALRLSGISASRTRGGAFSITFHVNRAAAVSAEIVSASGKIVTQLQPFGGRSVEGLQTITWNGKDNGGVVLPSGVYLLHLRATDEEGRQTRATIPLVLTR